jgi:acetoacetate decarboxylase
MRSYSSVASRAWAMPWMSPSYPAGPFVYKNREFLIVTYRTTRVAIEGALPTPLQPLSDPCVRVEFSKCPSGEGA